ncbi:hypothetical protein [Devosia naphthalenivorans]|uniref:hypothetical protein n=1 Tax=Devosia naphthalenivorans TaxID=2082392 RepID=UPI000D38065B|nr:hypothetical protein [Devosia naphthalenivorans]
MITHERMPLGARMPWDAVIVTVRRSLGRTVADVAAMVEIADFPLSVPRALDQAATWCREKGLSNIRVILEDEQLWNADWGTLTEPSTQQKPSASPSRL